MLNFTQIQEREMKENVLISSFIRSINHSIYEQKVSWLTSLSTAMEKYCKKQMQKGKETSRPSLSIAMEKDCKNTGADR